MRDKIMDRLVDCHKNSTFSLSDRRSQWMIPRGMLKCDLGFKGSIWRLAESRELG